MSPSALPSLDRLPGAELIRAGLADLTQGRETVATLLVEIAAGRLEQSGLTVPPIPVSVTEAEIRLYRKLGEEHGVEADAQYNALLRRLSSFCRALEGRQQRAHTDPEAPCSP